MSLFYSKDLAGHAQTIGGLRDAVLTVPTLEPLISGLMINLPYVIVFLSPSAFGTMWWGCSQVIKSFKVLLNCAASVLHVVVFPVEGDETTSCYC